MITRQQIEAAVADISAVELVSAPYRIANPRQVAVGRRYDTFAVYSYEQTKTGRYKAVVFHDSDNLPLEAIKRRVENLVDSAIAWGEAQERRDAEIAARDAKEKADKQAHETAWVAKLRFAKSGQTENPLEGTENQFRCLSTRQLMLAGTYPESGISVALPVDPDKRAAFLAKLDSFLHSL